MNSVVSLDFAGSTRCHLASAPLPALPTAEANVFELTEALAPRIQGRVYTRVSGSLAKLDFSRHTIFPVGPVMFKSSRVVDAPVIKKFGA